MFDGLIFKLLFCGKTLRGMLPPCLSLPFRYSVLDVLDILWTEAGNGTLMFGPGEVRANLVSGR